MKRNLTTKTLFLLASLSLVSCGGASSSSASTSMSSDESFAALTSGLNSYFNHDDIGFNFSRHPDTIKNGKHSNDFSLTYAPVEQTSATSSSSGGASGVLAADTSSSSPLDLSQPSTIGISGWATDGYPASCYLNGLKDEAMGSSVLGYAHLDYPTFTFTQGDNSPTSLSEVGVSAYLDLKAFYLDLSGISFVSAINSAVQQIPGNEGWEFPSGRRGKTDLPKVLSDDMELFLPLDQYLMSLTPTIVKTLQDDYGTSKKMGLSFSYEGNDITLGTSFTSFSDFYTLFYTWTRAFFAPQTNQAGLLAWSYVKSHFLEPIEKYGNCLSSFSLAGSLTYNKNGLSEARFVVDGTADDAKLKAAYASENPSGFVTAFHGAGVLGFVVDADAKIPEPKPALSTYPDIPAIKLTSVAA